MTPSCPIAHFRLLARYNRLANERLHEACGRPTHLFNHRTHHRGQAHDLLSQTEVAPPSLDLHRVLRPHHDRY